MTRQELKDLYYHHADSIADCTNRASDSVWRAQGYFLDYCEPKASLLNAEQGLELALDLVRTLKKAQAEWDAKND